MAMALLSTQEVLIKNSGVKGEVHLFKNAKPLFCSCDLSLELQLCDLVGLHNIRVSCVLSMRFSCSVSGLKT